MKSRSRREVIEDIQYAAFWLANEVHSLPPGRAFLALLGEISDEAIDLAVRCTTAGRQITAVLTDALATKLHGDPCSEYRLEWTEEERLDSAFLVVSALHMEALRRRGVLDVRKVPPDPWAPRCGFRVSAHRGPPRPSLERMGTNESVSPESLEVSTGFCHFRGGRPAHGAPHVSAETNDLALVRRIAVSERAGN